MSATVVPQAEFVLRRFAPRGRALNLNPDLQVAATVKHVAYLVSSQRKHALLAYLLRRRASLKVWMGRDNHLGIASRDTWHGACGRQGRRVLVFVRTTKRAEQLCQLYASGDTTSLGQGHPAEGWGVGVQAGEGWVQGGVCSRGSLPRRPPQDRGSVQKRGGAGRGSALPPPRATGSWQLAAVVMGVVVAAVLRGHGCVGQRDGHPQPTLCGKNRYLATTCASRTPELILWCRPGGR